MRYLQDGILPKNLREARALKVRVVRFTLIDKELYKRGFSLPLLKFLNPKQAEYVLREIHEGSCGNHSGARSLAKKVFKARILLAYNASGCSGHSQKCQQCQRHANHMHKPASLIQPLESPCPSDMWGMNIVGKLPRVVG